MLHCAGGRELVCYYPQRFSGYVAAGGKCRSAARELRDNEPQKVSDRPRES